MRDRNKDWYGVDFDGTLATYDHFRGTDHCGDPIPEMVSRVKMWLAMGRKVRILTARVYCEPWDAVAQSEAARAVLAIQDWCQVHIGAVLPVTCVKDYDMEEFWDDRAIQIIRNTGIRADGE